MRWNLGVTVAAAIIAVAAVAVGVQRAAPGRLEVSELTDALGVRWWVLEVPEGVQDRALGFAFKNSTGVIREHGGCVGIPAGTDVKVYLFDFDEDRIRFALTWPGGSLSGSAENELLHFTGPMIYMPNGSRVQPGQIFLKSAREGGAVSLEPPYVEDGQVGVTFEFGE